MKVKIKFFYKLVPLLWVTVARHAQSTQNNKPVFFLQYFKEEGRDEVNFLHADKSQTFLQGDSFSFGEHSQLCPEHLK